MATKLGIEVDHEELRERADSDVVSAQTDQLIDGYNEANESVELGSFLCDQDQPT
jgi:hypothetical protein